MQEEVSIITGKSIADSFSDFKYSGVYLLRCKVNGKIYIGQSTNINQRIKDHRCNCQNLTRNYITTRLYLAMRKYGVENFTVEILEKVEDLSLIDTREQYYLDLFTSYNNKIGYNTCPYVKSNRGVIHSDETKKKISDKKKGIKQSPELIAKRIAPLIGRKRAPEIGAKISIAQKGKKVSEATKQKLALANKGRVQSDEEKSKRVESMKGYKHSSETIEKIRKSNTGKVASKEIIDTLRTSHAKQSKPILKYNKDMSLLKEYVTISELSRIENIDRTYISRMLSGKRLNTTNYLWQYKSTEDPNPNPIK